MVYSLQVLDWDIWNLFDPLACHFLILIKDLHPQCIKDHAIITFDLTIGSWMCHQSILDENALLLTKVKKFYPYEVRS